MDDSQLKNILDMSTQVTNGLSEVNGIISSIYKSHMQKYISADSYLVNALIKKGEISEDDLDVAAKLYLIPTYRKKYKCIAKTLYKADALIEKRTAYSGEQPKDVEDDWLSYFLDRVSIVSDESVQNIFAAILTQECCNNNSIRKVMIDRLALLDRKSANLFLMLCQMTYRVEVSDEREYYIPLYLRQTTLRNLPVTKGVIDNYSQFLLIPDSTCPLSASDLEPELSILQEIGLINLSEEYDEADIYSTEPCNFEVWVGNQSVGELSLYDENQNVYYICTGNITYTKMGLELYNALNGSFEQYPHLFELIAAYIELQKRKA